MAGMLAVSTVSCGGGAQPTPTTAKPTAGGERTPAGGPAPAKETRGDASAGKQLIVAKGCGACHVVPGVPEAKGTIGPNLTGFASRPQIAGAVQNTPDNLRRWLADPPAVKQGTQMPKIGLSEAEVENLAAYLYTLR
jgi:cytochrome c1